MGDDEIQNVYSPVIKNIYGLQYPPRIEDIAFLEYFQDMKNIYNVILHIPIDRTACQKSYRLATVTFYPIDI